MDLRGLFLLLLFVLPAASSTPHEELVGLRLHKAQVFEDLKVLHDPSVPQDEVDTQENGRNCGPQFDTLLASLARASGAQRALEKDNAELKTALRLAENVVDGERGLRSACESQVKRIPMELQDEVRAWKEKRQQAMAEASMWRGKWENLGESLRLCQGATFRLDRAREAAAETLAAVEEDKKTLQEKLQRAWDDMKAKDDAQILLESQLLEAQEQSSAAAALRERSEKALQDKDAELAAMRRAMEALEEDMERMRLEHEEKLKEMDHSEHGMCATWFCLGAAAVFVLCLSVSRIWRSSEEESSKIRFQQLYACLQHSEGKKAEAEAAAHQADTRVAGLLWWVQNLTQENQTLLSKLNALEKVAQDANRIGHYYSQQCHNMVSELQEHRKAKADKVEARSAALNRIRALEHQVAVCEASRQNMANHVVRANAQCRFATQQ